MSPNSSQIARILCSASFLLVAAIPPLSFHFKGTTARNFQDIAADLFPTRIDDSR
jgi:hypothetical protein